MPDNPRPLLQAHLDVVEELLIAHSRICANAGHTIHRGTPREAFVHQFLRGHLSGKAAIGTGEVIDRNSLARDPRNQVDVVIYDSQYPRIDFGGGVFGFLAESVFATIEVKSILDEAGLTQAVQASRRLKGLDR